MAKYIKYGNLGNVVSVMNDHLSEEFELGMGDVGELNDLLEETPDDQNWLEIPAEASKTGKAVKVQLDPEWFE